MTLGEPNAVGNFQADLSHDPTVINDRDGFVFQVSRHDLLNSEGHSGSDDIAVPVGNPFLWNGDDDGIGL